MIATANVTSIAVCRNQLHQICMTRTAVPSGSTRQANWRSFHHSHPVGFLKLGVAALIISAPQGRALCDMSQYAGRGGRQQRQAPQALLVHSVEIKNICVLSAVSDQNSTVIFNSILWKRNGSVFTS
ncbi:hypothetical protein RRG08_035377 [Elysia crispata]|uniref:Uncharacterized protein n=1 Tax=Elysia crispata TaxID=231223 RepID=A0AAE1CS16_9GAST|nr:hypothetical protein RRG08_035377 [Elysia crispata]